MRACPLHQAEPRPPGAAQPAPDDQVEGAHEGAVLKHLLGGWRGGRKEDGWWTIYDECTCKRQFTPGGERGGKEGEAEGVVHMLQHADHCASMRSAGTGQETGAGCRKQGGDARGRAAHLQKREVPATVVHCRRARGIMRNRSKQVAALHRVGARTLWTLVQRSAQQRAQFAPCARLIASPHSPAPI